MRNRLGFFLALVLFAAPAYGQDTLWTRDYGFIGDADQGMSGCLTSDGGFVISGYSVYFPGGDIWVVRADSNGDTLWTRNFGNTRWQQANHVIETRDGGFMVVGKFSVAVGDYDLYMIRLDANGDSLWTRLFGTAGVDDDGQAVIELADGGFLAVGAGRNAGTTDLYMVKVDSAGTFQWQRYHGGSGSDYGYGVVELADGGFIMTGSTGTSSVGLSDLWVVRTDSTGANRWNRRYDYHADLDRGDAIVMADNGDFVIGGRTWNSGRAQLLGLRVDTLGNQIWASEFGWLGDGEFAESIDKTFDGGFVIGGGKGYTTFDFYVVRLNADGDSLWAGIYNGATGRSDDCYEIRVDDRGDIFAFGYTDIAPASPSDLQYWVVKLFDSALQGDEPEIDIAPLAFNEIVGINQSVIRPLYIANIGTTALQYGLHSDQPWITISADTGDVLPSGIDTVEVTMTGADEQQDTLGYLFVNSNDADESVVTVPIVLLIAIPDSGCVYIPGDINYNGQANGIDIVFGVNYFKGGPAPAIDCGDICLLPSPFYAAGDVNGNCAFNGIDVTFFVNYLKGIVPALLFCPSCPPAP